jgi:NDP-4-keto-2,6-dideoxyhexose 3-C-methyltransferase
MEHKITTRTTCRVCGSSNLTPLFSLGEQYVSDFVKREDIHNGIKCPIDLEVCNDCTLVQMKHTAPQDLLYKRHYWYRSGVTQTMRDALEDVALVVGVAETVSTKVILDIGSNDGTLLSMFGPTWIRIGCEPASNLNSRKNYEDRGLICIRDFWSHDAWQSDLRCGGYADVITALGMFYDLENPSQFIADVARVLHKDGVFIAQLMCLKNMVNTCDVGNMCHEHLEFYSLKSLDSLYRKHGLQIFDIQKVPVNGESYRIFACHTESFRKRIDQVRGIERVENAFMNDADLFHNDMVKLRQFFEFIECNAAGVAAHIVYLKSVGKRVWVYGASTKGNVLLQYYGLTSKHIEGAADRSPEKHGLYTIGTGIPIHSEEYAREHADYFLVLPYAFLNEFIDRETAWRQRGGKFIVPLPELRIV